MTCSHFGIDHARGVDLRLPAAVLRPDDATVDGIVVDHHAHGLRTDRCSARGEVAGEDGLRQRIDRRRAQAERRRSPLSPSAFHTAPARGGNITVARPFSSTAIDGNPRIDGEHGGERRIGRGAGVEVVEQHAVIGGVDRHDGDRPVFALHAPGDRSRPDAVLAQHRRRAAREELVAAAHGDRALQVLVQRRSLIEMIASARPVPAREHRPAHLRESLLGALPDHRDARQRHHHQQAPASARFRRLARGSGRRRGCRRRSASARDRRAPACGGGCDRRAARSARRARRHPAPCRTAGSRSCPATRACHRACACTRRCGAPACRRRACRARSLRRRRGRRCARSASATRTMPGASGSSACRKSRKYAGGT